MRGGKVKKLRLTLTLTLLTLVVVSVLAPLSQAVDYQEGQIKGTWDSYYPNAFAVAGDNTGSWGALWDAGIHNFSAVHIEILKTNFGATIRPFSFSDFKFVNIHFQMVSGLFYDNYIINTNITNTKSWFGLASDTTVNFGGQYSVGVWKQKMDIYILRNLDTNNTWTTRIAIWDAGGKTTLANGTVINGFNVFWEKTYTGKEGFFNNDLLCALYVEHEGSGYFNFTVKTTFYTDGEQPEIIEGINVPEVVHSYKTWIQDLFDFISGAGTFFLELLKTVGSVTILIAPYLSLILIFYLMDVAVTSVKERSFAPVGIAFTMLYGFLLQIWEGAIALGALIWDAITFWN